MCGMYGTPRAQGEDRDARSRAMQAQLPNAQEWSSRPASQNIFIGRQEQSALRCVPGMAKQTQFPEARSRSVNSQLGGVDCLSRDSLPPDLEEAPLTSGSLSPQLSPSCGLFLCTGCTVPRGRMVRAWMPEVEQRRSSCRMRMSGVLSLRAKPQKFRSHHCRMRRAAATGCTVPRSLRPRRWWWPPKPLFLSATALRAVGPVAHDQFKEPAS